jgi:nucleoside-diphosphate-sugar epimerase
MLGGMDRDLDLVTGAFGNVGAAIATALADRGRRVRTLTSRSPAPGGPDIDTRPFSFDSPTQLTEAFAGVDTFYNTYWMRQGDASGYANAVARSTSLFDAAAEAGVRRIVHVSVIKPALDSPYPYFRAKAEVEEALLAGSVPAAIVRPALIFGGDAALLHNLAWLLRRMPVFAVPGDGRFRVRPVHVDDVAALCLAGADEPAGHVVDAVGPERPTFLELVTNVRDAVGSRARIIRLPPRLVLASGRAIGAILREDLLTRDELLSTMEGIADSDAPATGRLALSDWLAAHADELGKHR